jgi:hypothetical protein
LSVAREAGTSFHALHERFVSKPDDPVVSNAMELLFELVLLAEGSEIAYPIRLNQLTLELLQGSL